MAEGHREILRVNPEQSPGRSQGQDFPDLTETVVAYCCVEEEVVPGEPPALLSNSEQYFFFFFRTVFLIHMCFML